MYSIDFRYHWLLNELKWWADSFHSSAISLWQRAHESLVMKKLAGMMPLRLVLDEDGKNGLSGPAPSSCIDAGTTCGFWIRYDARRTAP